MEDQEAFLKDLAIIEEFSERATPQSLYIAGILRNKTSMNLPQIVDILTQVEELSDKINATQFAIFHFMLFQGKAREVIRQVGLLNGLSNPSQRELVKKQLKESTHFEEVEVKGKVYAKNLFTGVITEVSTAQKLINASQDSLGDIENDLMAQRMLQRRLQEQDRLGSEELARKLQEEFDKEVKPEEPLSCMICIDTISEQDFLPLENCGHMFHPACVLEHIETLLADRTFPISCPLPDCKVDISVLDLQERLSPEQQKRYLEYSFDSYVSKNGAEVSCCPTPDCKYVFVLEPNESHLNCPVCENEYCVGCRSDWHKGFSCEEYRKIKDPNELDKMFEDFVNGQNFKRCPHCHFWVERTMGCDHMSCRCGNHFCYRCGGDYGRCACVGQSVFMPAQPARRRARARRPTGRRRR